MEKDEKILAIRQRNRRIGYGILLLGMLVVVLPGGLVWSDNQPKSTTPQLLRYPQEKLRSIQALIHAEGPPRMVVQQQQQQPAITIPHDEESSSTLQQQQQQQQEQQEDNRYHEQQLVQRVRESDQEVRRIKASTPGILMEVDPAGVAASKKLQEATRTLLEYRYGPREPYRVKVDLKFQESNPTVASLGTDVDSFVIEMAPSSLQPHSIFTFLEIARQWHRQGGGAFHRRANHVLQVVVKGNAMPHLAFQEYSKEYPHKKGTVGYAGRPSGPGWYVSIQDNTRNHGPGSQQQHNPYEADSCFGTVVEGFEDVILKRVTQMPGMGFLKPPEHVLITNMTIQVPTGTGHYKDWIPPSSIVEFSKH